MPIIRANRTSDLALHRLAVLEGLTQDLHRGVAPTGWGNATTNQEGGVAIRADDWTLDRAKNGTVLWELEQPYGRFMAVRLPLGSEPRQAGVLMKGVDADEHYRQLISGMTHLGADATWDYYWAPELIGPDVVALILQVTGSDVHVDTTTFGGGLSDDARFNAVADTIKGGAGITVNKQASQHRVTVRTS